MIFKASWSMEFYLHCGCYIFHYRDVRRLIGKTMSVPPSGGLLSFAISPSVVTVPGWRPHSSGMPIGSRKTTVYRFLKGLLQDMRVEAKCKGN